MPHEMASLVKWPISYVYLKLICIQNWELRLLPYETKDSLSLKFGYLVFMLKISTRKICLPTFWTKWFGGIRLKSGHFPNITNNFSHSVRQTWPFLETGVTCWILFCRICKIRLIFIGSYYFIINCYTVTGISWIQTFSKNLLYRFRCAENFR